MSKDLTPEFVVSLLQEYGTIVTAAEAKTIMEFMIMLAKIALDQNELNTWLIISAISNDVYKCISAKSFKSLKKWFDKSPERGTDNQLDRKVRSRGLFYFFWNLHTICI